MISNIQLYTEHSTRNKKEPDIVLTVSKDKNVPKYPFMMKSRKDLAIRENFLNLVYRVQTKFLQ